MNKYCGNQKNFGFFGIVFKELAYIGLVFDLGTCFLLGDTYRSNQIQPVISVLDGLSSPFGLAKGRTLCQVRPSDSVQRGCFGVPHCQYAIALLGVERINIMFNLNDIIMFNLNDITAAILDAVVEAIKSDLKVTLKPLLRCDTMTMEVQYAGVTFSYISRKDSRGQGRAILEALEGFISEDEIGDTYRSEEQPWNQYVYIEDGADPFLDIARGHKKAFNCVEVTGTPWTVMNHAMETLATWALQAGMDNLQKR